MRIIKLSIFITGCILCSCTPYLYVPSPLNMPLAGNKGDFKGGAFLNEQGVGIQASYAVDSHCVVLANFEYASPESGTLTLDNSTYNSSTSNFLGDIGAGYYKKFGVNNAGRLELLGGLGYGTAISQTAGVPAIPYYDVDLYNLNGGFLHLFAQGDIGMVKKNVEFAFGLRFSNLNINAQYNATGVDQNNARTVVYSDHITGDALLYEPSVMVAIGIENIKFTAALGYSHKLFGPDIDYNYGNTIYDGLGFSLGAMVFLKKK